MKKWLLCLALLLPTCTPVHSGELENIIRDKCNAIGRVSSHVMYMRQNGESNEYIKGVIARNTKDQQLLGLVDKAFKHPIYSDAYLRRVVVGNFYTDTVNNCLLKELYNGN